MNYCVVAFAIVLIVSVIQWFVDGRKNFTGPKMDANHHFLTATITPEMEADGQDVSGSGKMSEDVAAANGNRVSKEL